MPRHPRGLRPEDRDLWHRVAQSVTPLHPARPLFLPEPVERAAAARPPRPEPVPAFSIGQKASAARDHVLLPAMQDGAGSLPVQMDRKAYDRMQRGKLLPESRIDLHGMTLAEAHPALTGFIRNSHAAGLRLVLVITGKGKRGDDSGPIPQRQGVLKHQVPQWLAMPPLAALVLQMAPAHLKHGGAGACYVYLRRQRQAAFSGF